MKQNINRTQLKAAVVTVLVLVVWAVFLWRVIVVLGPDSLHSNFDSDSAIPVLMANDARPLTVFDAYYYGQDRWGGWPMAVARIIHHATGFWWSDQRLHIARAIWLFIGILLLASLNPRAAPVVVVTCLIPICLNVIRLSLFDISQPYSWQITALLLGWFCARRIFTKEHQDCWNQLARKRRIWYLLLFLFSFLSIWSSPVSAPMLVFLVAAEALHGHLKSQNRSTGRSIARRFIYAEVPVIAATLVEILIRMDYHRHVLKHWGSDLKTPIALDVGYLATNLRVELLGLSYFTWWGLMLIPLIVISSGAVALIYFRLKGKNDLLTKARRWLVDETAVMIAGTLGIAIINFALIVIVSHVRLASYLPRFMTLTVVFGSISGLLTIYLILQLAVGRTTIGKYLVPTFAVAALLFLIVEFPLKIESPRYMRRREIALSLAQRTPGAILMGGYWETYVFAGLQPPDTMTPLPIEGRYVRLPWTRGMLRDVKQVVIEYRESKLTNADSLPRQLEQYGNSLRLIDADFYENGEYSFALYVNESK